MELPKKRGIGVVYAKRQQCEIYNVTKFQSGGVTKPSL